MNVRYIPSRSRIPPGILSVKRMASLLRTSIPDAGLLICVLGLLVFGWVMVYSSSALAAEIRYHDQYFFLKRQMIWSFIGLVVYLVAANVPLQVWQSKTFALYFFTIGALIAVLLVGPSIAGARRWIRLGGFSFQPSEIAKVAMVFVVADYMDRRQSRLKQFSKGLLPLLFLVGVLFALILVEPDLGTPVLMGLVLLALLILGGARWRHLLSMGIAVLPVLILAIIKVRYRLKRLFAYVDPWSDPQGTGYQLVQSLLAMGSGGIFGRGLGGSRIKISNLPDAHTDFVFSVIGEELGLLGTLTCVALFLFLCMWGLQVAKRAPTCFSRLVAAGLSLTIGIQAVINMGVASGLFPTKGMPLPFLSFGGSSLVIIMMSIGLLANISRQGKKELSLKAVAL